MGSENNEFKEHEDDQDSDELETELEDDNEIIAIETTDNEDIPDDHDSDSASDVDSDYSESEIENSGSESESGSIQSLRIGREPKTKEESEENESDDILKIIKEALGSKRLQPPNILNNDVVTQISFSPTHDIIAVGTMEGDICLYSYDVEKTDLILQYSAHMGSCRRIEYSERGDMIYTVSDDKSVIVVDSDTGKFKNSFDGAHNSPIYSLMIINDNLFTTGDDEGFVKLWDRRKREEVFSIKIGTDYVSSLHCLEESNTLVCTAGDGVVSSLNTYTRKMMAQSEPYDAEFTCSDLFLSNTKLAVGTSTGSILLYSWGQFSTWNDEFPGLDKKKHAINCMIPVTENIVITGLDNGFIRATNLFPMRHVGIVGQHSSTVECLDISREGTLLASCSIENKVCFWNIEYFEDIHITDKMKTNNLKAREHNLPSSYGVNSNDFFSGLS